MHALLAEHVAGDGADTTKRRLPGRGGCLLQAGFDGVDGSVAEGAHSAADKADEERLVAGEFFAVWPAG